MCERLVEPASNTLDEISRSLPFGPSSAPDLPGLLLDFHAIDLSPVEADWIGAHEVELSLAD